jgi:multifunctional 2-oxoglutarate metabolism enzyme
VAEPQNTQQPGNGAGQFGANDWLIEEMRERYQADPSSVDASWVTFFQQSPAAVTTAATPAAPTAPASPTPPPATVVQPTTAPAATTPTVEDDELSSKGGPQGPGSGTGVSADRPRPQPQPVKAAIEPSRVQLRGAPARTAVNMDASLAMPTATSVRQIPMKLVIDQRQVINAHLSRTTGGKVSFTHLLGWAMVQALKAVPPMNNSYEVVDGKPFLVTPGSINLGLAIDMKKPDGTRQLVVPNIKNCEDLDFAGFWQAYEALIAKARAGKLEVSDFAGSTASLTNPGGIGTNHSVPRLMPSQGVILGVGSIDYPPEFQGTSASRLTRMGVSKVTTLTSTYDHRVIQGAQSGEFLKYIHQLLIGQHEFFDQIFDSLRVPYAPIRWTSDITDESANAIPPSARVFSLINSYRTLGHYLADIDPLEYRQRTHPELELEHHGLTLWDLDREFPVGNLGTFGGKKLPLRKIVAMLRDSYCRTVGVEYMHLDDAEQRAWIQERFEQPFTPWPREEHLRILDKLNEAEVFETFLQTKFVGQKRFSLEGGESTIVFLDEVCERAADGDVEEVVIGMPHRGRLNVLANIVGKSYAQIFREFQGNYDPRLLQGSGDVKYHLGAEGQFTAASGKTVNTSVAANPSHLEAVNPVVEGIVRAKIDKIGKRPDWPVMPVLLHGDAAFAGQGVVYETLQMSQLRAFKTGGTIHLVVNNQVGFTTAPIESRSTPYCTDVAKGFQIPIFHVNGDDPEAVARVAQIAFDYRQKFNRDVVVDVVCYRRRGHNEGDDPSFTQPLMYDLIEQKRSTRTLYTEALIGRGDITTADAEEVLARFRARLEGVFKEVRDAAGAPDEAPKAPYYPAKLGEDKGTAITAGQMEAVARAHLTFPEGFAPHPKVLNQLKRRAESIQNGPIDWATAELLAFGSLLMEGRPVRLVGQDSRRGTFSQRFAAIVDRVSAKAYVPLKHLSADQGSFHVFDSLLSEYAGMGFEYGYSVAAPDALVLWEAQFGDFANGAQTIADEFISAANAKWTQKSGVVLLLPHGYEGQGPDHSSARLERWLTLCSEGALAVSQPSTPASYFHLLRTHAYVNWHRPVVIATPKSMLRSKMAASPVEEFTQGSWRPAQADPTITDPAAVKRILICSGKIRWELVQARAKAGLDGQVAILSLERLYPIPAPELAAELAKYPQVTDIRWVQDEPENQGAWWFLQLHLPQAIEAQLPGRKLNLTGVTRPAASAPSVGSIKVHQAQEEELLHAALAD